MGKCGKYRTEAELCAELVAHARSIGFKAYPETAGQDVLLVAGPDARGFKAGDQIGVQAKLRANVQVLAQAMPRDGYSSQPNYYAVLVPVAPKEFVLVANRLKITVLSGGAFAEAYIYDPFRRARWFRFDTRATCWVPECEVEGMPAGTPAPKQLTKWKLAAVKLCMRGVEQGFLTSSDFKEFEVSMTRWRKLRWIVPYDTQVINKRKVIRYVLNDEQKPPHLRYSEVTDALGKAGAL